MEIPIIAYCLATTENHKHGPNPWTIPVHESKKRFRWAMCGNRSGKTELLAVEAVWWAIGIHPYREAWKAPTPAHVWAVSVDFPESRDVFRERVFYYCQGLERLGLKPKWSTEDQILTFPNGSTIGFKSCASGADKFQGTGRHLIIFDEEPPDQKVFDECLARLTMAGFSGEMLGGLTPSLRGLTWFYERVSLGFTNKTANEWPQTMIVHASTWENVYLTKQQVDELEGLYVDTDIADARLRGLWVLIGGKLVFSSSILRRMYDEAAPGMSCRMEISKERLTPRPHDDGELVIWEMPQPRAQYVVGMDVAEGLGQDNSAGSVVNKYSGNQAAEFTLDCDPDIAGTKAAAVARLYNMAELAIERNSMGQAALMAVKDYPRLYFEHVHNQRTKQKTKRLGWRTTGSQGLGGEGTRNLMIADFARAMREDLVTVNSRTAVEEMMTFVYDEKGRATHQHGAHDDHLFALMIAWQLCKDSVRPVRQIRARPGTVAFNVAIANAEAYSEARAYKHIRP